jgi:sulfur carrier protein ThiS
MKVKVKFSVMPELVRIFKGKKEVPLDFPGETLKDLFHHLALKLGPRKKDMFLDDRGRISPHVLVLINGKPLSGSNQLGQRLQENDVVELTLPLG